MSAIKDIMTKNPICLTEHTNVHKARMLMAEKSIRHIPVKNLEGSQLIGLLSQKALLSNAIKIINQRGLEKLEHEEKSIAISTIMDTSPSIFNLDDQLIDVAKDLIKQKSGCVSIVENNQLVGVITSNDFVKLAIEQLS